MSKGKFRLKWPWNWLLYGAAFLVAGWYIGYLWAGLAVAACAAAGKAKSAPEGSYCLDRTRKRLARLLWALLDLLFAAAGGVCFYMQLQEDRSAWELGDWAFTIFSAGLCLVFGVLFFVETYMDLRDAFFPAKSRLAQSIRSQLPYPDEAPPVEKLFDMVDQDIRENGLWFDRVAIGHEWVLGDDATSIPRIRGVFLRDEIRTHDTGRGRKSTRILELWIVDDRKQTQCTDLRKPGELKTAADCLRLRAPEARFGNYDEMSKFLGQSEEDWQGMERDFRRRRDQRLAQQTEEERQRANAVPSGQYQPVRTEVPKPQARPRLTISDRTGATHEYDRFTRRDVELAGEGLANGKYTVVAFFAGPRYLYLKAGGQADGRVTVNASRPDPDKLRVFETKCTDRQAQEWLLQMSEGVFAPDFTRWKDITKQLEKETRK